MPSILIESEADIITYGMGEKPTLQLSNLLSEALADYHPALYYDENGEAFITRETFRDVIQKQNAVPQTVSIYDYNEIPEETLIDLIKAVYHYATTLEFLDDPEIFIEPDEQRGVKDIKNFIELLLAKAPK